MADEDTLLVWEHPLSPYAQKVKIALAEKGLRFVAKTPDAFGAGAEAHPFRAENFRGEVPVLVVDGAAIADSTIILEFIEERYPSPPLLPDSPFDRARARMIEEVCDTQFEAVTWGLSEIIYFRRAEGALAEGMKAKAGVQIARLLGWLERHLGEAPWLSGSAFGWADLAAAPHVQSAAGFGFGPSPNSPLADWLRRCRDRPSVAAAFEAARDAAAIMTSVSRVVEAGGFRRQYRDHRLEWMIRSGGLEIVRTGLERDNIRFNVEPS